MNYKLRIKNEIASQRKSQKHWEARHEELADSGHAPNPYAQDCKNQAWIHRHMAEILENIIK
jgi:hypothetical protein